MKKYFIFGLCSLFLAPFMTGCLVTRIFTEAPTTEYVAPPTTVYSTTVTTPSPKVTKVTTVTVTNYSSDPCFYLDLNAVAAAFAESRSVKEFEQLLNSGRYMINNLDLNKDGWIDYLRVIETRNGYYHVCLIQACLAPSVFQDVATLIAERRPEALYVEVIGDAYLYGRNYIVRPVFMKRPPIWDTYGRANYAVWSSPYYYGYYPSYYTKPQPIYLNHYQAYVTTYMTNHVYCRHCDYPTQPYYSGYTQMTQPYGRHDYQTQYPEQSFERRTRTITASNPGVSVNNAGQLRQVVANNSKETTSTSTSTTRQSNTTATSTSSTTRQPSNSTTTRQTGSSTTRQTSSSTTTRQPSTTVESRVKKSGTTSTTIRRTDSTGRTTTVKRESSSSNTSSRSSRGTTNESNQRSDRQTRSTTRR